MIALGMDCDQSTRVLRAPNSADKFSSPGVHIPRCVNRCRRPKSGLSRVTCMQTRQEITGFFFAVAWIAQEIKKN